jgi:hypothetical protein
VLHPVVLSELLKLEVDVALERHVGRFGRLEVDGSFVLCWLSTDEPNVSAIRLDGARYDAEPFAVDVVDGHCQPLSANQWPAGLCHGDHPVLQRPFACIQGTYEYHTFPGHTADSWDQHRAKIRLPDLLDHLLRKAGR